MFTFRNYYVLKLLLLETITFSDATLSDINVVLCYVLSQYRIWAVMTLMVQVVDDLEKEKGTKSTWSREGELQAAQESKCNKVGTIPSNRVISSLEGKFGIVG
jgi:hypothetical protein